MSSIAQYRTYLSDYLEKNHNMKHKQFFRCINPKHTDNNPSMMFTEKYNICHCFSCGVSYDIFDVVGIDYHLDNFREQLLKIQELYLDYIPVVKSKDDIDNRIYDYTNYFKKCKKNISKTNYLQDRGINSELIEKYNIGYDIERKLIIFPINKHCYFGRSTINNNKVKSKGKSDIWNKKHLLNSSEKDLIYVTEGIIDSLSLEVIDPTIKTISINGIGNINQLIHELKQNNFKGNIIIAFDNDKPGLQATKILKEELTKINVNSFSNTLISGFGADICSDLNNALLINKEKLKATYEYVNTSYIRYLEIKNKKGEGIEIE